MTTHGYEWKSRHQWKKQGYTKCIDSLDPRQFAVGVKAVLRGLDAAIDAGLDVKVNSVLLNDFSDSRLRRFLAWLKDMPVTLRFIELMETGNLNQFFNKQHQSGTPLKSTLLDMGWQPLLRRKDAGPAQEFYHPDYAGKIGLIMPYSKDFCKTLYLPQKLHLVCEMG